MPEHNYLSEWVQHLLDRPTAEPDGRYGRRGPEAGGPPAATATSSAVPLSRSAWEEVENLKRSRVPQGDVYRAVGKVPAHPLRRLHQHLRGARCEEEVWSALIGELADPLPDDLANDLLDRNVAVDALGHSRQRDPVQWRLASFHPVALVTLGIELFTDPQRLASEVIAFVGAVGEQHRGRWWLLDTLARRDASDAEKEQAYLATAEKHPDSDRLRQIRHVRHLAAAAADASLGAEALRELHASGEPHVWLALASNSATPTDVVEKLAETTGHKFARQIRNTARARLVRPGAAWEPRRP